MSQSTERLRLLFYLPTWPGGKKNTKSTKPPISPHIHIHQQKRKNQKENHDYDEISPSQQSHIYIQGHRDHREVRQDVGRQECLPHQRFCSGWSQTSPQGLLDLSQEMFCLVEGRFAAMRRPSRVGVPAGKFLERVWENLLSRRFSQREPLTFKDGF